MNLREGKSHQGPTDHNEVQDVPQVTEVGARVEQQPQVNHLQRKARRRKSLIKHGPNPPCQGPGEGSGSKDPSQIAEILGQAGRKTLPKMKLKSINHNQNL